MQIVKSFLAYRMSTMYVFTVYIERECDSAYVYMYVI